MSSTHANQRPRRGISRLGQSVCHSSAVRHAAMFGITAAFMAGLGWPTNVNATTDPPPKRGITMHLKIDGIGGDSKRKAYAGPIEVIAWSWSLTNPTCFGSRDFGRCGNVARVNLQDLTLTKFQDGATAGLLDAAATGRVFKQAVLTAVRNNSAGRLYSPSG